MAPRAFLMFFCVPPPDIIAPSLLSTKKEKKKRKKKITKEQSLRSQQTNTNWKLKLELLHAQQENQEQKKPTRSSQDNGKKNYDTKKATRVSKAKPGSSKLGRENTTENKHHQQPTQKPIKTQFFLPSNHIEGAHKPKSYQKKNYIKSLPSYTKNGAEFDEQLGKQRFQFQNRPFPTRRRKMRTTWSSVRVVEVVGRGVEMERWAGPVFEGDFYTSFPSYLLLFLSFNLIEDL